MAPSSPLHVTSLLLLASLLLGLQSLPLFSPDHVPTGDGFYRYQVFYWYYSDFFHHGEWPLWMPYGTYGMPAWYHQWVALSPSACFMGWVGAGLGVTDTRLLFAWVCVLEGFWYVLGVVLLAQRLFHAWSARLFVVIGAVLGLTWWAQPYLNLLAYQGLPLVCYFLVRLRQEGRLAWLWIAAVVAMLSLLGNFSYAVLLYFWVLLLFMLPGLVNRQDWPGWQTAGHGPWLALALVLGVGLLSLAMGSVEGVINLSPGRDAVQQSVTWRQFLTYARLDPQILLFSQATGAIPHWEQDPYLGWAAWGLFLWALLRVRSPWLTGLALMVLFLVGTTFGHGQAWLVYHLPGMDWFRHISYLLVIAKVWVLFGAGFGVQALSWSGPAVPWRRVLVLTGVVLALVADGWWAWRLLPWPAFELNQVMVAGDWVWLWLVGVRLLTYLLALAAMARWRNQRGALLVAAFLVDMGLYQGYALKRVPMTRPPHDPSLFQATPLPYMAQRSPHTGRVIPTPFGRSPALTRLLFRRGDFAFNLPVSYMFSHHDPCFPQSRMELMSRRVVAMLESRGGQPRYSTLLRYQPGEVIHVWQRDDGQWRAFHRPVVREGHDLAVGGHHVVPAGDPLFWQALGCDTPKLRWGERIQWATDEAQASRLLAAAADPFRTLVLQGLDRGEELSDQEGSIQVTGFTSNRLRLAVHNPGSRPRWLTYADAWHPHWTATVDGQETPVVVAQVGFKAILVEPGPHQVVWQFTGGWVGFWCLLLAIGASLATVVGLGWVALSILFAVKEISGILQPGKASLREKNHDPHPDPGGYLEAVRGDQPTVGLNASRSVRAPSDVRY